MTLTTTHTTTTHTDLVREQVRTLAAPRRSYGLVARSLFGTMNLLYGRRGRLEKFLVLELVARVPYQTWEHAAYLSITRHARNTTMARRIYDRVRRARDQQDNEQWHLFIIEDMLEHRGTHLGWFRYRLLPQIIAFGYYIVSWLLYLIRPAWSYALNADFEDHAEHEYMAFVADHPELEFETCSCSVADDYGCADSFADVLRQIGVDERHHKDESLAELADLAASSFSTVNFSVLGPVEVTNDDGLVALPGTKPRKLLARLLLDANSVVSVDALIDALWTPGEAPPLNAPGTIQVYVSNLRRILGPSVIRTAVPGYALDLDGHTYDAQHLAGLVATARSLRTDGHVAGAIAAARSAIGMPRGEPFADFAYEEWAQAAVRELTETVLSAHDELHASLLAADLDDEAIPQLERFGARYPYRERARAQLMLALYRTGRQADALRTYSEGRDAMVDALGVEPGSELQQLVARILDQDPDLLPTRARVQPPVPIGIVGSTIVGRIREQRTISSAITRAEQGAPQVVLVDGPAGIGKSVLGHWASDHATAREVRAAAGRAHDLDGAPSFWPWSQPLRSLELADAFDAVGDSPFHLYASACERLATATQAQPMLLVLDDMQWADRGSIEFLKFLARASSGRLTVVAMYRSVPPDHPIAVLAADLSTERAVTRLVLEPLADSDAAQLVEHLTGGRVTGDVARSIARRTGGNPFFVEELVRLMDTGDGEFDVDAAAVPRTVADLLRRRAEALSADAVAVLTSASFLSGPFSAELPAAVTDQPENSVRAVFDAAVADGILVDEPGRIGWRSFAHDLVRHSFYDPVAPMTRAEMHLRIGEVLAASLGDRARAAAPELAAHFAQAAGVGGAERAVHWSRVASDRAIEALAYEDAVRHLRRALFVTRRELRDRSLECDVLLDLAGAARLAADQPTAARAAERAEQIARTLDGPIQRERARTPMLRARRPS